MSKVLVSTGHRPVGLYRSSTARCRQPAGQLCRLAPAHLYYASLSLLPAHLYLYYLRISISMTYAFSFYDPTCFTLPVRDEAAPYHIQWLLLVCCSPRGQVPAVYEFQLDDGGAFAVHKAHGTLAPLTTTHVAVTFRATTPAGFWQRAIILIKVSFNFTSTIALSTWHLCSGRAG